MPPSKPEATKVPGYTCHPLNLRLPCCVVCMRRACQISYEIASIQLAVMSLEEEAGRPVDKIQETYLKVKEAPHPSLSLHRFRRGAPHRTAQHHTSPCRTAQQRPHGSCRPPMTAGGSCASGVDSCLRGAPSMVRIESPWRCARPSWQSHSMHRSCMGAKALSERGAVGVDVDADCQVSGGSSAAAGATGKQVSTLAASGRCRALRMGEWQRTLT